VPSGSGLFLRLLVWKLGTPKLAQIFAYGKRLYTHIMLVHGASVSHLDQRCLKTRNSEDGCTFPQYTFILTPKITPKTPFWGTFQCKTYYTESSHKSHVTGATKLKLYSYISIGKYLGCVKIFPLGGVLETHGPLMQIWDPLLSQKLL